jgi:hypothetical protein
MAFSFRDWIFNRFPYFYKAEDTYKDGAGEGLWERYCRNYGLELDEEIVPELEDYLDILEPLTTDSKFLNHIAYRLGNPPDIFNDESIYRRLLTIVFSIYKIRGTSRSYELLFALLGFSVTPIANFPEDLLYDDGHEYDEPDTFGEILQYDQVCDNCVEYSLLISAIEGCYNPESEIDFASIFANMVLFQKLACFIEPINAKLIDIIPSIPFCENNIPSVCEEITIEVRQLLLYDGFTSETNTEPPYDDGDYYDYIVIDEIVIEDCGPVFIGPDYSAEDYSDDYNI